MRLLVILTCYVASAQSQPGFYRHAASTSLLGPTGRLAGAELSVVGTPADTVRITPVVQSNQPVNPAAVARNAAFSIVNSPPGGAFPPWRPFRYSTRNGHTYNAAAPAPYAGAVVPAPYAGAVVPVPYARAVAPVPYAGAVAPVPYAGAVVPVPYTRAVVPVPYARAVAPVPYAGAVAPVPYAGAVVPVPYTRAVAPVPYAAAPAVVHVPAVTRTLVRQNIEVPVTRTVHYADQSVVTGHTTTIHKPGVRAPAIAAPGVLVGRSFLNPASLSVGKYAAEVRSVNHVLQPYAVPYAVPEPYAVPTPVFTAPVVRQNTVYASPALAAPLEEGPAVVEVRSRQHHHG